MDYTLIQQYTNTYPIGYSVKPRQPVIGSRTISTISTMFVFDIITPYGMGENVVSNPDQDNFTMVAWGMIVRLALLAPGPATLTMEVDLFNGTFVEIDTSPVAVALNAKVQFFTFGPLPAFKIRGRLAGDGSTYSYHASCTDY